MWPVNNQTGFGVAILGVARKELKWMFLNRFHYESDIWFLYYISVCFHIENDCFLIYFHKGGDFISLIAFVLETTVSDFELAIDLYVCFLITYDIIFYWFCSPRCCHFPPFRLI